MSFSIVTDAAILCFAAAKTKATSVFEVDAQKRCQWIQKGCHCTAHAMTISLAIKSKGPSVTGFGSLILKAQVVVDIENYDVQAFSNNLNSFKLIFAHIRTVEVNSCHYRFKSKQDLKQLDSDALVFIIAGQAILEFQMSHWIISKGLGAI